jgi:predicted transposase/invertase (TIGR01784 family)
MRIEKLVYHLLQQAPQGFFALIGRKPEEAARYQFTSVEIKETSFRLRGVFAPKAQTNTTGNGAHAQTDNSRHSTSKASETTPDDLVFQSFEALPQSFFSLIGRNPKDAAHYDFKSVELKEPAFRIDAVFIPKDKRKTTYLVKAQFQKDERFYANLFAEVFLYLYQYSAANWQAVVIYTSRRFERVQGSYAEFITSSRKKRIYLDELPESYFVAVALFELLITPEAKLESRARKIAQSANNLELSLLLKILSYKNLTKEEVRKMLGIEKDLFKETIFYKEVFEEGKAEGEYLTKRAMVPLLRELGLSDEQIAQKLQLPLVDIQNVPKS